MFYTFDVRWAHHTGGWIAASSVALCRLDLGGDKEEDAQLRDDEFSELRTLRTRFRPPLGCEQECPVRTGFVHAFLAIICAYLHPCPMITSSHPTLSTLQFCWLLIFLFSTACPAAQSSQMVLWLITAPPEPANQCQRPVWAPSVRTSENGYTIYHGIPVLFGWPYPIFPGTVSV